ncbi:uncharacterized protein LOC135213748 isoform X2 [Macrobrachium nipponense]|uniref:uncharacterized protein LOC135213748 isoform X2 n=1 Tax=Macrobrachium nipponense TaxID=159736 RepID=UPI0030C8B14E
MADAGVVNPAFVSDETPGSTVPYGYGPLEPATKRWDPTASGGKKGPTPVELQKIQRKHRVHRKSASVGTPIQWTGVDSTPAKVLRAWTNAQERLAMESNCSCSCSSDSEEEKGSRKNKGTQTEEPVATLSSWRIIKTRSPHQESASSSSVASDFKGLAPAPAPPLLDPRCKPSASEYLVVESRSLGFEASTQTREAFLFRFSDVEAFEMVMAWRMLTIFLPITWYMIMYVADQVTDVAVAVGFCYEKQFWWCGLSLTFLILPHVAINFYAYEQLVRPDIASVAPVNKWFARALLATQIAPHYIIGRKWSWCFRAWRKVSWKHKRRKTMNANEPQNITSSNAPHPSSSSSSSSIPSLSSHQQQQQPQQHSTSLASDPENPQPPKPQKHRKSAKILWEQAKAETYSESIKLYQSLLVSTPQLAIQTYVLMVKWVGKPGNDIASYVEPVLISSVIISLTSASEGLASVLADKAWEKMAASTAIFLTLGSRVMVLGGVGTIDSSFWFIPVSCSLLVGVVTKICESKERTAKPILIKMPKYISESFVMATICPPFNALGVFTSVPYVVAGIVFLLREPGAATNIVTFIFSIFGQVAWLAVGFFVT